MSGDFYHSALLTRSEHWYGPLRAGSLTTLWTGNTSMYTNLKITILYSLLCLSVGDFNSYSTYFICNIEIQNDVIVW